MRRRFVFMALVSGLFLLALTGSASAQVSIWLKKGTSGAGVAGLFAHNEDQTTYGVNGGYSIQGYIDLDLTVAYLDFPTDPLPDDLVGVAIAPRVELHPLKQGPSMPVSLGIGGGVTVFGFASDELEAQDAELASFNLNADASLYRFFKLAPNFGVTPAIGAGFVHTEVTLTQFGSEETTTDDAFSFQAATYLAFLDANGHIWGIAPQINVGETTTFAVRAGLVWTL
jgi:hypothetical protein